ncbi:MAG: hypothetical protein ACOCUY_03620 [Verrucomicrobiota bacterium]
MMKKWMIRFMSVLAVFALGVGVTGCGQDEDPGTEAPTTEEEAEGAEEGADEATDETIDDMDNE